MSGHPNPPARPEQVREATSRSIVTLRWTTVLGAVGTLASMLLNWGHDLAAVPVPLRRAILAGLGGAELIALVAFATIVPRLSRERGLGALIRGSVEKPGGRTLEDELAAAYLLYSFKVTLDSCSLLVALMLGAILYQIDRGVATLANLGLILALIGAQVPTRRRMEAWSRRLAASRIDTLPPPGFLD